MKFLNAIIFGFLAMAMSWVSTMIPGLYGMLLLVGSLPFWLLFIVFAIRGARPE